MIDRKTSFRYGGGLFFVWLDFIRLLLLTRTLLRACAVRQRCPFFVVPQRNGERKSAKGPNALWKPAARKVVPLSLHSFFRESKHLQLLRRRFKEKRRHGRRTQRAKANALTICDAPGQTKFQTKTLLLSPPAARDDKAARDAE